MLRFNPAISSTIKPLDKLRICEEKVEVLALHVSVQSVVCTVGPGDRAGTKVSLRCCGPRCKPDTSFHTEIGGCGSWPPGWRCRSTRWQFRTPNSTWARFLCIAPLFGGTRLTTLILWFSRRKSWPSLSTWSPNASRRIGRAPLRNGRFRGFARLL